MKKSTFYLLPSGLTFIVDEPVKFLQVHNEDGTSSKRNGYCAPTDGKITNNFWMPFNAKKVEQFQFHYADIIAEWKEELKQPPAKTIAKEETVANSFNPEIA